MIDKMTPEQEAQLPVYKDKWIEIGLCTDRLTLDTARPIIDELCTVVLKKEPPKDLVIMPSPISAWKLVCVLAKEGSKLADVDIANLPDPDVEFVWPYLDGQFNAGSFGYYEFMQEVMGVKLCDEFNVYKKTAKLSLVYTIQDTVWVLADRPMEFALNAAKVLHKDLAPAVHYSDGFSVWMLNGVRVPRWLAETPRHEIDPKRFAKIKNSEIRREFVRKLGVEAICEACGAQVIDKEGDYELLNINLGGTTGYWPYLKMKNPSIGVWHVEAVTKECTTVAEALELRNKGRKGSPVFLT